MKIYNVRLGFANNSSSTHSIMFVNPGLARDEEADGEFGWNLFTCASRESKELYFAVTLKENLNYLLGSEISELVIKGLFSYYSLGEYDGIDHQSRLTFPCSFRSIRDSHPMIDLDFYKEFSNYYSSNPNVAILGGNDNDDLSHSLYSAKDEIDTKLGIENYPSNYVCRWDDPYQYWTLFNKINGSKVRMSFDDSISDKNITKSSVPDLVDIKITDYCDAGCSFCYQSSTEAGTHGELEYISDVIRSLSDLEVFEVALGGGETTSHPDFVDILNYARLLGIVPNFTTKRLDWANGDRGSKILELCGSFAYSVNNTREAKKFKEFYQSSGSGWGKPFKGTAQIVLGTVSKTVFRNILRELEGIPITLLGYKSFGFGSEFKPINYDWWLDVTSETIKRFTRIGIDSALVAQYPKVLEESGVSNILYYCKEGAFSCYIDAVAKKIGPSSYSEETDSLDLKSWDLRKTIKEKYASY